MSQKISLPGVENPRLLEAYAQARRFLRRRYVTGISIGQAWRGGVPDGMAICIHVDQKVEDSQLSNAERLPREIAGVPVDVIECVHRARGMTDAERRARRVVPASPALPGVEIAVQSLQLGTLGMIVMDSLSPDHPLCLLSAAHVLDAPEGAPVYQPGREVQANLIGHVGRRVWNRYGDAAIAPISGRSVSNIPLGSQKKIGEPREVRLGEVLLKSGSMTGLTRARVTHVGEFRVTYSGDFALVMEGFQLAPLDGESGEISDGGDSGSVWHDEITGQAIGLTVAGDSLGAADPAEWAFACHMVTVFKLLDIAPNVP